MFLIVDAALSFLKRRSITWLVFSEKSRSQHLAGQTCTSVMSPIMSNHILQILQLQLSTIGKKKPNNNEREFKIKHEWESVVLLKQ